MGFIQNPFFKKFVTFVVVFSTLSAASQPDRSRRDDLSVSIDLTVSNSVTGNIFFS